MNVLNEPWQTNKIKLNELISGESDQLGTQQPKEQVVLLNQKWEDYAIAYKEVADHLVNGLQDRLVDEPHLACPIMYLYRHYLELSLKEIINHLLEWHDVEDDFSRLKLKHQPRMHELPGHPLMDSWDWIRSLIEQMEDCKLPGCSIDGLDINYDAIEKRIQEFDKIDRSSFNYRYPVDNKGRPNRIRIPDRHELAQVKAVVEAIGYHLSSISYAVREATEELTLLFDDAVDSYYQDLHADYLVGQWKDARYLP